MSRVSLLSVGVLLMAASPQAQGTYVPARDSECVSYFVDEGVERTCRVFEVSFPAPDRIAIDGGGNGGVEVVGWDRDEVLVRAEVLASSRTAEGLAAYFDRFSMTTGETIRPALELANGADEGWSYLEIRVYVPKDAAVSVVTHNGSVGIAEVRNEVRFTVRNGSVSLENLDGDVQGTTANGSVSIALSGSGWTGPGLDVSTRNGSVTLGVPPSYAASLDLYTRYGRTQTSFPDLAASDGRFTTDLGGGGPPVRVSTNLGSVSLVAR